MKKTNVKNVSFLLLKGVIQSERQLEALAFAIQIKTLYVNSKIKNPTKHDLKEMFGLGYNKLS